MKSNNIVKIEITSKTILFTIAILLLLSFARNLVDLFLNLFIAFILMSALKPTVDYLSEKKIPRSLAAIAVVIILMTVIFVIFYFALPPLFSESVAFLLYLSKQFVNAIQALDQQLTIKDFINFPSLTQQIPNITNVITKTFVSIFGNIMNLLSIFFFTLYFLLGINQLDRIFHKFFNSTQANFFITTLRRVEKQLGLWMRAELVLMLIIGVFSYIGLTLLNVKYALPLAVIAGMLEVFPIVGPIVSAIPAFMVASTTSGILAVAVVALYIVIQQLENNVIVPLVMKRAIGIPPLAVLLSVIIGQKLAGFPGIVLAVPFVATITIILKEVFKYRENESVGERT